MVEYPSGSDLTDLKHALVDAVSNNPDLREREDGIVLPDYFQVKNDRLYGVGRTDIWYDLSGSSRSCPKLRTDGVVKPRRLRHPDDPMETVSGFCETDDGWLLLSTDGTSWTPQVFVPEDKLS